MKNKMMREMHEVKKSETKASILRSNKSVGQEIKERKNTLQNEKNMNMADEIERSMMNYQK